MTPVYPMILAGIFRVFGEYTFATFVAAALLNILATTLACVPIYYAGRRMLGVGVGAGAAWLWAVFPNAFQIPTESMWDASIARCSSPQYCGRRWSSPILRARWPGSATGFLWGLALMTSATLASLLPLLLGWLSYRRHKQGRPWLAKPLLAAAVAALCCVPWTVRNYEVFHSLRAAALHSRIATMGR